ncbi:retrotransposon protein, putative, ty1-copia subclass [Tanacetum coccineum]|uniref:Retrotransposon protein, putative, ty1-copia subclass n=1 Tax=Tanacetum coccineum TaxID=301880 RepID=A0ABQ5EWQ2_9ASTR
MVHSLFIVLIRINTLVLIFSQCLVFVCSLSTTSTASEARPASMSFATLLKGDSTRKGLNFRTLITSARNGIDVAVSLESIRVISQRVNMDWLNRCLTILPEYIGNVPVWVKLHGVPMTAFNKDGLSAIATKLGQAAMIEIQADVELKDTIMVAMPKLVGEGFYTCIIRVEYEWKPPRCACCKVFGHVHDECPKNIGSDVAKNLKKPSQASRGVPVGLKARFQPVKQVNRPISKNKNANTSGNKKKDAESRKEVINPNPFDVLNSVENDVDLGTNGGTSNLASKELEKLLIDGKITLVDDEGKPLEKVDYPGDHDSEDEIESVDNEMTSFLASEKVGYDTNSLLEQLRETYENADYNYDLYDDDMYEGHEIPDKIQSICDNLIIKLRDRCVLLGWDDAESGRMVESKNHSPQQPPQATPTNAPRTMMINWCGVPAAFWIGSGIGVIAYRRFILIPNAIAENSGEMSSGEMVSRDDGHLV